MSTQRRREIANAALHVLATTGPRGLTHRAVDTAAGLGSGAVNYHAPSKSRLLELAVERLFELDLEVAAATLMFPQTGTVDPDNVADALVTFVRTMTARDHIHRVRARHELLAEARRNTQLHKLFTQQRAAFVHYATQLLARMGCPEPKQHGDLFVVFIDSLLTRQAIITATALSPEALRDAARRQLRSYLEITSATG